MHNRLAQVNPNTWYGKALFGGTGAGLADPAQRAGIGMGRLGVAGVGAGVLGANGAMNQYEAAARRDRIRQMSRWQLGLGGLLGGPEGVIDQLHL